MPDVHSHILGLRTVIYRVPDLARAVEFYERAFGMAPYFNEPYYAGFQVGGFELGLDPDLAHGAPGRAGATPYFGADDLDAALAHVVAAGAAIHEPVREVGGGIRVATVTDPFGNVIGLIHNPHFDPAAVR